MQSTNRVGLLPEAGRVFASLRSLNHACVLLERQEMQSFFARLENFSRILRIFQAALVPPAPALPEKVGFGVATAASSHPLLPCALMEAAEGVLAQLGGAPDLCFLQTQAAAGAHLRLAPQLAQTFLRGGRWGLQPAPVLIGSANAELDATVLLTAATLPGPQPCPAAPHSCAACPQ